MMLAKLSDFVDGSLLQADLVIVGAGPVGLTLARHCAAPGRKVLVLESGLECESADHSRLNAVESVGEPASSEQLAKRAEFHGSQSATWSQDIQPFGVRCRAVGGSTHAWAGKSAPFDKIDFEPRDWVPGSGWPLGYDVVAPFVQRAMVDLNLCPDMPDARFAGEGLHSQYWQFARSRVDRLDIMRFGREFLSSAPAGVQILTDATVTQIALNPEGTAVSSLAVQGVCGKHLRVESGNYVLAAGGIENARLLLASRDVHANGIGNGRDLVGRYLMDHVGARIAHLSLPGAHQLARTFGFYGVRHEGRSHMFMHGLALTDETQAQEQLLNAAVYFMPQRALDNPWDALKRLLQRRSPTWREDLFTTLRGSRILMQGVGMKMLTDDHVPQFVKDLIVNLAIRLFPNVAAEEFVSRGVPHKVTGIDIHAICEQIPNAESRITLSAKRDPFGTPLARVDWRIADMERRTVKRLAQRTRDALSNAGLPAPKLDPWVEDDAAPDPAIIDMGHTLGATRMSAHERDGVVDTNCKVHGLGNLYVAGGSVFPTSGHANPTLMILSLSTRLADCLNSRMNDHSRVRHA